MYSSCDDLFNWVNSNRNNAELFIKTLESIYRRNLVLIVDKKELILISCFSSSNKRKRLRH